MGPKRRKRSLKKVSELQIASKQKKTSEKPALSVSVSSDDEPSEVILEDKLDNKQLPDCSNDISDTRVGTSPKPESVKSPTLSESESEREPDDEPPRPFIDCPAAQVFVDHGYSGAPPLFMRKSDKSSSVVDSIIDQRKRKLKDIEELLQTQSSNLIICPRECHGNCVDVHHPILVALLNCRDVDDKKEMKKKLKTLASVVRKYIRSVSIEFRPFMQIPVICVFI